MKEIFKRIYEHHYGHRFIVFMVSLAPVFIIMFIEATFSVKLLPNKVILLLPTLIMIGFILWDSLIKPYLDSKKEEKIKERK